MKLKLLLFFFFVLCGGLSLFAQDTIKYLVISETRMDESHQAYVELTNMSETEAINLGEFEFGTIDAWTQPYTPSADRRLMLPEIVLWPGESFVIANIWDLAPKMVKIDPERWESRLRTITDLWTLADLGLYPAETDWGNFDEDSVSLEGPNALDSWDGRSCYYIRQHLSDVDSVVIDAVNANFIEENGTLPDGGRADVAGVTGATATHVLLRKFSVKEGSTDWQKQAGIDLNDSQWMPVPEGPSDWGVEGIKRKAFWTIGNHSDFQLNADEVVSNTIDINFVDTAMVVPWGVRKGWRIMGQFDRSLRNPSDPLDFRRRGDGLAWSYAFSPNREDSAFASVRTGDVLTLYAAGNNLQIMNFRLTVAEPTDDANTVIPKVSLRLTPPWTYNANPVFDVSEDMPVMDTIYNIPFATRVDTLLKYLEKAPAATWEVIYKEVAKPELIDGDKLKVTAQNGAVKEYYIKISKFLPSHDAYLSAITWPDMPSDFAEIADFYGWKGDTIPMYSSSTYNYTLMVPLGTEGIPALIPKKTNLDTKVDVIRAKNIAGSLADRTVIFNTAAEDDTTFLTYRVILEQEKDPANQQPYYAEPFISQYCARAMWGHSAWEICNPGNQQLDLSHYMFMKGGSEGTPAAAIQAGLATDNFGIRYNRYVPGKKWTPDEATWQVQPGLLISESNVNFMVDGGDVFVIASVSESTDANFQVVRSTIQFNFNVRSNPWGESSLGGDPADGWTGNTYYLFKILSDSVLDGTKWVGDPNDFELIDVFGPGDGTTPSVGGRNWEQLFGYTRKPHIFKGNPDYKGSFGTNADDSEWLQTDRAYWGKLGYGWPVDCWMPLSNFGTHTFDAVTVYRSTVTSNSYKVSPGYSPSEQIRGVVAGTTVEAFLAAINKDDQGQTLTVKSADVEITGTTAVTNGDVLEVLSADGKNITKYALEVTVGGLSNDALLTSTVYTIGVTGNTGTVSGFPFTTDLETVADNVVVPAGATFTVVNDSDDYVSYTMLNYDTTYVKVKVNSQTYFEVVAENGVNKILYQLVPTATLSDAYVTSSLYAVDQTVATISFIPRGTATETLLGNLIPAAGATVKLYDKYGFERTSGNIYQDDKVVVTSADGTKTKVYYMSMQVQSEEEVTDYLAYVLSNVYEVDQVLLKITVPGSAVDKNRATFLGDLIPALGANIVVLTSDGIENSGTYMANGNKLKVTAADGETVVYYQIQFTTSASDLTNGNIKLYPNPTTGMVNINGIESGNRISVFNAMGVNIREFVSTSNNAVISLNNEAAGMYLILVNNASETIGRFKVVKK